MTVPSRLACARADWRTPEYLLDRVRTYFGGPIPLDPATAPDNPTRAERILTPAEDGLSQPWHPWGWEGTFINPPYGPAFPGWLAKIAEEALSGMPILALLPVGGGRMSCPYWHQNIWTRGLTAIAWIQGRVAFIDPATGKPARGNQYPSAIFGFNVGNHPFADAFGGPWAEIPGRARVGATVIHTRRIADDEAEPVLCFGCAEKAGLPPVSRNGCGVEFPR